MSNQIKPTKAVQHRFLSHTVNPETTTLIIGTFNPDTDKNDAHFFYSRSKNYLWRLVPIAFKTEDLKGKSKEDKLNFIEKYKVDFIDLITEVEVEAGKEANYYDGYIDSRVIKWRDVLSEIVKLRNIKKVCFTRKTFADIPEIKKRVELVRSFCKSNGITFQYLTTPARFYSADKQLEWSNFFSDGN